MSIFSQIFDGLRDRLMDMIIDESKKSAHEQEERRKLDLEENEKKLKTDLKRWIENGIPIPKYIKAKYPYLVTDFCVKANRSDLVRDFLPMYIKQKRLRRWKTAENVLKFFYTLFKIFVVLLFIYVTILILCNPTGKHIQK